MSMTASGRAADTPVAHLAVPLNLLGSLSVQNQAHWELVVVPHASGNVITVAKLIGETVTLVVEQKTTDTTQGLSSQELDLGVGLRWVNETSGVNLNLLKIDSGSSNIDNHLLSVTSAVVTVSGGQVHQVGAVAGEETVLGEIGSVSTWESIFCQRTASGYLED